MLSRCSRRRRPSRPRRGACAGGVAVRRDPEIESITLQQLCLRLNDCEWAGEQLLEEGWENELSEGLFGGEAADELASTACKEWSSACRKAAPKADKARKPGPKQMRLVKNYAVMPNYDAWAADMRSQNGTRMDGDRLQFGRPRPLPNTGEALLTLHNVGVEVHIEAVA